MGSILPKNSLMMKAILTGRGIGFLFIVFFGLALYGFFKSYFGLFPDFHERITLITHLHSISITLWMLILIIQPFLIHFKQHRLHRQIGTLSYYFVSFLGIIIILQIRQAYLRGLANGVPQTNLLAFQFVPLSAFTCSFWAYIMAMLNRKKRTAHRSYMVVHTLAMLWAAFGRMDYSWLGLQTFQQAIAVSYLPSACILAAILVFEWVKEKKINRVYMAALGVFLATPLFWYYCTESPLWQGVARLIFE